MSFERLLFVGGQADGEWHQVDVRQSVYVIPVRNPLPVIRLSRRSERIELMHTVTYHRMQLSGESERFTVMVPNEVQANDLLRRLLENYRPQGGRPVGASCFTRENTAGITHDLLDDELTSEQAASMASAMMAGMEERICLEAFGVRYPFDGFLDPVHSAPTRHKWQCATCSKVGVKLMEPGESMPDFLARLSRLHREGGDCFAPALSIIGTRGVSNAHLLCSWPRPPPEPTVNLTSPAPSPENP